MTTPASAGRYMDLPRLILNVFQSLQDFESPSSEMPTSASDTTNRDCMYGISVAIEYRCVAVGFMVMPIVASVSSRLADNRFLQRYLFIIGSVRLVLLELYCF